MKVHELIETAMPPQDARKWFEDTLHDLAEYGDISFEMLDDVLERNKLMWTMTNAFTDLVDKIPEDLDRQKMDDAIFDAAQEVWHQHVGSIKSKEK